MAETNTDTNTNINTDTHTFKNLSSIGSSLAGGLGSLAGTIASVAMANKQIKANREQYEQQRKDYLSDRQHEESYNSPAAQKARLRAAGMNTLNYMDSPVASQTAQNNASLAPVNLPVGEVAGGIQNLGQMGMVKLQADLAQSQTIRSLAGASKDTSQTTQINRTMDDYVKQFGLKNNYLYQQTQSVIQGMQESVARIKNINIKTTVEKETLPLLKNSLALQNALYGENITAKNIENNYSSRVFEANLNKLFSEVGLNKASTENIKAKTVTENTMRDVNFRLACGNIMLQKAQTALLGTQNASAMLELRYNQATYGEKLKMFSAQLDKMIWDSKQAKRDYKWSPVNNIVKNGSMIIQSAMSIANPLMSVAGGAVSTASAPVATLSYF